MKNRILINLESARHQELDYHSAPDLCFTTDQQPDLALVSKIDKAIKRLTSLSRRNKELFMEKTIRVDWGTLAFMTQREKSFPPRWVTSNCLGVELKLTDDCKLKLQGPAMHFDTRLLQNPDYRY